MEESKVLLAAAPALGMGVRSVEAVAVDLLIAACRIAGVAPAARSTSATWPHSPGGLWIAKRSGPRCVVSRKPWWPTA